MSDLNRKRVSLALNKDSSVGGEASLPLQPGKLTPNPVDGEPQSEAGASRHRCKGTLGLFGRCRR
jgi:hypothetical protein